MFENFQLIFPLPKKTNIPKVPIKIKQKVNIILSNFGDLSNYYLDENKENCYPSAQYTLMPMPINILKIYADKVP